MNATEFELLLSRLNACKEAYEWAKGKSMEEVWTTCHRGDWMLWLFNKMQDESGWGDLRNKTLAKVRCVRLVEHLLTDKRSKNALDVAQKFAEGTVMLDELNAYAAYAATAATATAYTSSSAAAYAATAAAFATSSPTATDAAAYAAAAAASATDASAIDAAYAAARKDTILKCADICRETLITPLNIHNKN